MRGHDVNSMQESVLRVGAIVASQSTPLRRLNVGSKVNESAGLLCLRAPAPLLHPTLGSVLFHKRGLCLLQLPRQQSEMNHTLRNMEWPSTYRREAPFLLLYPAPRYC